MYSIAKVKKLTHHFDDEGLRMVEWTTRNAKFCPGTNKCKHSIRHTGYQQRITRIASSPKRVSHRFVLAKYYDLL